MNPTDIDLIVKCCKLLTKVLPKLKTNNVNLLKSTFYWILPCILCLQNYECQSKQIENILNFYICLIQTCGHLKIKDNKVRNYFKIYKL